MIFLGFLLDQLALEDNLLTGRMPLEVCELRDFGLESFTTDCPMRDEGVVCPIPTCCTSCRLIAGNETLDEDTYQNRYPIGTMNLTR